MKILFQGDSITDAGRSREASGTIETLGRGYPKYSAELIAAAFPQIEFEFINKGISGNKAEDLRRRWQEDAIDIQPDIISILIGVNDTWHRATKGDWMPHEYFEICYRDILTQIKEKTNAKIIILEQFLLETGDKSHFHVDLDPKIQVTRKLAREFADAFIPLDGLFAQACIGEEPAKWAADGVHPTPDGAQFIAGHYLEAVKKLIG